MIHNPLTKLSSLLNLKQSIERHGLQRERTLKELANQDDYKPLYIQIPHADEGAANFELKPKLIQLLPKFHGLADEDPYKQPLKEEKRKI